MKNQSVLVRLKLCLVKWYRNIQMPASCILTLLRWFQMKGVDSKQAYQYSVCCCRTIWIDCFLKRMARSTIQNSFGCNGQFIMLCSLWFCYRNINQTQVLLDYLLKSWCNMNTKKLTAVGQKIAQKASFMGAIPCNHLPTDIHQLPAMLVVNSWNLIKE